MLLNNIKNIILSRRENEKSGDGGRGREIRYKRWARSANIIITGREFFFFFFPVDYNMYAHSDFALGRHKFRRRVNLCERVTCERSRIADPRIAPSERSKK